MRTARQEGRFHENARSTKKHTRLVALPNIARSRSARTQFVVSVVPALHTRYYGRDAPVPGYAHKMGSPRLRILLIHRPQWHDSRQTCTFAAGSSLPNPQRSQRTTNGRTRIWILVSARRVGR